MKYKLTIVNKATGEKKEYEHTYGSWVWGPLRDFSVKLKFHTPGYIEHTITFQPEELRNIEILEEGELEEGETTKGEAYSATYSLYEYKAHRDEILRKIREEKEREANKDYQLCMDRGYFQPEAEGPTYPYWDKYRSVYIP